MKFEELWNNHPTIKSSWFDDDAPCIVDGERAFENQCAIRMGVCLTESGVDLSSFTGARCWHNHNPSHILRAQELGDWLRSSASPFKRYEEFDASAGFSNIGGKKGIIFFKNYYGPGNQGDHIDLWNGSRLTSLRTWFEFTVRGGSHYEKASVTFWPAE
ncbi:type VI secretion system amidase effector protein Tae4 [Bowmanella denitrificans]|uniref:type VI secretion system amidase effector protein Tae4 n=1 Tax=Bowmanella denitrificans TaxID=366582 RepID=UPI000C9A5D49|nr:type VI secretion system amidase effector protein Tae4 [Bowmanella denitrificans]